MKVSHIFFGIVISCFTFNLSPSTGFTKLFLDTNVVSGKIESVASNVIELEGVGIFYPSSNIKKIEVKEGSLVTLSYYINSEKKKIYVEVQKGLDSLQKAVPPEYSSGMLK